MDRQIDRQIDKRLSGPETPIVSRFWCLKWANQIRNIPFCNAILAESTISV